MEVLYRIYTEDKADIIPIAERYFKCFSVLTGVGFYNGQRENSAVIEVIADRSKVATVYEFARAILFHNQQKEVLVTNHEVNSYSLISEEN